jgi:hypothetical protein
VRYGWLLIGKEESGGSGNVKENEERSKKS